MVPREADLGKCQKNTALKVRAYLWEVSQLRFDFPKTKISCASWCVMTWSQSHPMWLRESPEICSWTACLYLFLLFYCVFTFLKAVRWNYLWSLVNCLLETCESFQLSDHVLLLHKLPCRIWWGRFLGIHWADRAGCAN